MFIINCLIFAIASTKKKRLIITNGHLLITYFSLTFILFAGIALIINFSYMFDFEEEAFPLRNYLYEFFLIFSSFSPLFVFVMLLVIPFKWIIDFLVKLIKPHSMQTSICNCKKDSKMSSFYRYLVLTMILIFSIIIVLLPHLSFVNEDNKSIAVDTGNYGYTIKELNLEKNLPELLRQSFFIQFGTHPNASSGDRPLTLLFIILISKLVFIDLDSIVDIIIPIILSPLLVIATYILVRELTNNTKVALIAAFLTTVSPHVMVGIYAGLFANWLALIVSFLAVYEILRYRKTLHYRYLIILVILLLILRFTHVYTWVVMTPVMIIFTGIIIFRGNGKDLESRVRDLIICSLIFMIPFAVGMGVNWYTEMGNLGGKSTNFNNFFQGLSMENLNNIRETLNYSINIQNGGAVGNAIILGLGVGWIYYFNKFGDLSIFISLLLLFSIIPVFFGNDIIQTRIIYNIPFQIPAAVTLYYILVMQSFGRVLFISIILCLIAVSVRFVSNLILNI